MKTEYLEKLNKEQRAAVRHGVKNGVARPARPLLIIAGAGTGKTNTLAHRVAHLLASGADPGSLMLLTFTRNAAKEMTRRAGLIARQALGGDVGPLPYAGTFHAVGGQLLKEFAKQVGLLPNFTIRDRGDAADLMDIVRNELGCFSASDVSFPDKGLCSAIHSYQINSCQKLEVVLKSKFRSSLKWRGKLKKLFAAYDAAKREQNVLDYDDLLLYWHKMLRKPDIANLLQNRFQYILVDEFQDTNRLQSKILRRLKPDGLGVTVVGDDAQAIYSFRAATVKNIHCFPSQYDPPARVIKLEQNYRSTNQILKACNATINLCNQAYAKELWSERPDNKKPKLVSVDDDAEQAIYIADQIIRAKEEGVPFQSQTVLMRVSHHSLKLELEFTRRNIPFVKWGGLKFLEAAHIKDVLSVLRWCENPRDQVAGFRALKLLPGVGPQAASKVLDRLKRSPNRSCVRKIAPPSGAGEHWPTFAKLIAGLCRSEWSGQVAAVVAWYLPLMKHDNADLRAPDLHQLVAIASTYETRERFLMEVTLEPPETTAGPTKQARQDDDDHVVISTIHSAKGREWSRVFLLNTVNGCIPSTKATTPEEIEEERRLLYVGMTRAKDVLELMTPCRGYTSRENSSVLDLFSSPTRFIPTKLYRLFKRTTGHRPSDGTDTRIA
jgi:DNA helicase II / ATP-dependent DNA helicase PcrA